MFCDGGEEESSDEVAVVTRRTDHNMLTKLACIVARAGMTISYKKRRASRLSVLTLRSQAGYG